MCACEEWIIGGRKAKKMRRSKSGTHEVTADRFNKPVKLGKTQGGFPIYLQRCGHGTISAIVPSVMRTQECLVGLRAPLGV